MLRYTYSLEFASLVQCLLEPITFSLLFNSIAKTIWCLRAHSKPCNLYGTNFIKFLLITKFTFVATFIMQLKRLGWHTIKRYPVAVIYIYLCSIRHQWLKHFILDILRRYVLKFTTVRNNMNDKIFLNCQKHPLVYL